MQRIAGAMTVLLVVLCVCTTTALHVSFKRTLQRQMTSGSGMPRMQGLTAKPSWARARSSSCLWAADAAMTADGASDDSSSKSEGLPANVSEFNAIALRASWISWWVQLVLSVISTVILTFANSVRISSGMKSFWASGFVFSILGGAISFVNTLWTWNYTRLCRRAAMRKIEPKKLVPSYRKYAKTSVFLALAGMLVTLLGAEQIVGGLASKALLNQGSFIPVTAAGGAVAAGTQLQALDIFLVQANTNLLVAHYAPLAIYVWLQTLQPIARSVGAAVKSKR